MKIKKFLLLFPVIGLATSCNTNSIAGTYAFQMGKDNGTHFGIFLKLKDKHYEFNESTPVSEEVKTKAKQFAFTFTIGTNTKEGESSALDFISSILDTLAKEKLDLINGYYYYGRTLKDEEREIKLGVETIMMKELAKSIVKALDLPEELDLDDIIDSIPDFTPEQIEKVLFTTYTTNIVTCYIPVSINDLFYQLYWYGYDLNVDENDEVVINELVIPEEEKAYRLPGMHPSSTDVEKINLTFASDHAKLQEKIDSLGFPNDLLNLSKYRDFNTVAMGLAKK